MSQLYGHYLTTNTTKELPRPLVYRRAPVYGLMVIRPVRIGREPEGQLLA